MHAVLLGVYNRFAGLDRLWGCTDDGAPRSARAGVACRDLPGRADGDHRADVVLQGDLVRVSAAGYWTGYYAQYFASHSWLEATANSFIIAFGSMVFTLLVALPAAFGFVRYRFRGKSTSTS